MEQLTCALEIQQLVLANNRLRWLPMVTENVEHITDDIRNSEDDRVGATSRVAESLGLPTDSSLLELAQAAGEPYGSIWQQARRQLIGLQAEIDQFSSENYEITRRGLATTDVVIEHLSGERGNTYDPGGATQRVAPTGSTFDRTA
jgi:predicted nuclease of predicted toxin-antitoxin system